MKSERNKPERGTGNGKTSRGILWKVLLIIAALLDLVILELGKHTWVGWVLTVLLIAGYVILRVKVLKEKGKGLRFLAWCGRIAAFALILWISWPPVKAVPAVSAAHPQETGVIHLAKGDVSGVLTEDGKVEVYAGIPYAKAPVGELRWKEPQEADPWGGVLKADHFAPMSMQETNLPIYNSLRQIIGYHDYEIVIGDEYIPPVSEDSLYVNVWKPAGAQENLPVLVYIHGGSLQSGQPWYQDYSGEGLAREGVIVVNMAYRLGVFGFFADPELAAESPNGTTGNYGLLDQIAALKWVQENIAAFGGDPGNVTVSGESAGSACVTALCTSPLAKGLFRRVIAESSTVTAKEPAHSFRLLDEAFEAGEKTKQRFGVENVAGLRALSAEQIVGELNTHHHITVDGYVLTETPYESYAKGIHNEEAQLHGFNGEEATPFILFAMANLSNYEAKVRASFPGEYGDAVLKLYPAESDAEARKNWIDICSVLLFNYGHDTWARQATANGIPTYMYYFTRSNGRLGTWHSGEEVYFYGNIPAGSKLYDDRDRELSREMLQYFKNFITNGDPNGQGLPEWTVFQPLLSSSNPGGDYPMVMELGNQTGMIPEPYQALFEILHRMESEEKGK